MWQWELLSTRGQTMSTEGLISFLKHISSLAVEIACLFFFFAFFFFPKPTTWCIQFQTVLELSKFHPESTRYSSLVVEKCAAIMNIMTVFVYRAGRQDIKVSLLMTNIKEMSVFRDGGNYVHWRLKSNFFNVCNSWNDPVPVLEKWLWKSSTGDGSSRPDSKLREITGQSFKPDMLQDRVPLVHLSASFNVWENWQMEESTTETHQSTDLFKCWWFVVTASKL